MDKITLEFTQQEIAAFLLLVKLGMDVYTGKPTNTEAVIEALGGVPNPVIDGMIAKVSRAGSAAARAESANGRTVPG